MLVFIPGPDCPPPERVRKQQARRSELATTAAAVDEEAMDQL